MWMLLTYFTHKKHTHAYTFGKQSQTKWKRTRMNVRRYGEKERKQSEEKQKKEELARKEPQVTACVHNIRTISFDGKF